MQQKPQQKMRQKPELLCPAGSFEKLEYAFAYGADAVYAGLPIFSLRARENEVDFSDLEKSMALARQLGKKVYVTANIFARNRKIEVFKRSLENFANMKPDALIMSDPGLIALVKERYPEIPIHLSVQANCMNWSAVKFWQQVGVERIILSRELQLSEIKTIKDHVPEMELEAFVHGSLCIAYSGRCLLSSYMSHRDANQGVCDNSCRYPSNVYKAVSPDEEYYLEDLRNPNELYRINEDEHGTYIMNSKDLCLIEHLKEIIEAGVCSLKIEGRTKSLHYLCVVTRAYRQALDDLYAGRPFDKKLHDELATISQRGYSAGFMITGPSVETQIYDKQPGPPRSPFVGVVRPSQGAADSAGSVGSTGSASSTGFIQFEVKGKIHNNAEYEVYTPRGSYTTRLEGLQNLDGKVLDVAHPGMGVVTAKASKAVDPYAILRSL